MSNPNPNPDSPTLYDILRVHFKYAVFEHESRNVFNVLRDSSNTFQTEEEERNKSSKTSRDQCSICLSDIYEQNEFILPCKHRLHIHCFLQLLESDLDASCPICRKDIPSLNLNLIPLESNDKEISRARRELRIIIQLWIGIQAELAKRQEHNEYLQNNLGGLSYNIFQLFLSLIDVYFIPPTDLPVDTSAFQNVFELDTNVLREEARNEWNNILKTLVNELISKHWHFIENMSELPENERTKMPSERERQIRLKKVLEAVGSLIDEEEFRT